MSRPLVGQAPLWLLILVNHTGNEIRVVLPLPLVNQSENFTNLKEVERGNAVGGFFLLVGTVAVLWLYVQYKLQQNESSGY